VVTHGGGDGEGEGGGRRSPLGPSPGTVAVIGRKWQWWPPMGSLWGGLSGGCCVASWMTMHGKRGTMVVKL